MANNKYSVYDYLTSTGRDGSYAARTALAKKFGITNYKGTSEQNLSLLSKLQSTDNIKPKAVSTKTATFKEKATPPYRGLLPTEISSVKKVVKPNLNTTTVKVAVPKPAQPDTSKVLFKPTANAPYRGLMPSEIKSKPLNTLQSGVIVDKRNGIQYIVKGGKVVDSFPVLTGKDVEGNTQSYPEKRATPRGAYVMKPDVLYGSKGYRLRPIETESLPTPDSEYSLSLHKTYDPQTRNKLYNMSGENRNASFGCVNNKECDLEKVTKQFPQGDTLMVMDSDNKMDSKMLASYMPKQYGLGSWLQENAGAIGTVAGAAIGTAIAPGIGTQIGASLGGSVGGAVQGAYTQNQANDEAVKQQQRQMSINNAVTNINNQQLPVYGNQFALGGYVPFIKPWMFSNTDPTYANGGSLNFKSPATYKAWLGYVHATGAAESTPGNQKVSIKGQPHKVQHADGGNLYTGQSKIVGANKNTGEFIYDIGWEGKPVGIEGTTLTYDTPKKFNPSEIDWYSDVYKNQAINDSINQATINNKSKEFIKSNPNNFKFDFVNIKPKKYSGILNSFKCGGKMYSNGGKMETTRGMDGMTYYANGGTHETNPLGGIPVGGRGLVEQGEFRFGDYIFSDRF